MGTMLEAALGYAARGWAVFALEGKRPLPGSAGFHDATTDPREIRSLWRTHPSANVGIRCDSSAGPLVLDIDGPEGMVSFLDLGLPKTLEASSGRKDRKHCYFAPGDTPISRVIKILPGLDVLGDGGYVVAPPSVHPRTGKPYRWLNDHPTAKFPAALVQLLAEGRRRRNGPAPKLPDEIYEGQRDDALTSLAGTMRRRGATEGSIVAALMKQNEERCRPPLPEKQVLKIARSIAQKAPAPVAERPSDVGNARLFVQQHQHSVRNVRVWGRRSWLIWEGHRWTVDETGEVERLAKRTIKILHAEAERISDPKLRDAALRHAIRSESMPRIKALLEAASSEPEIATIADLFDADPWLFNLENGTLDLRSGELSKAKREDLLTKRSPISFDPEARCPLWMRFLRDVTNGDDALIGYLQRVVGYALTGDVREQCLFFCYGTGQNGKSTFLEVLREMFGDYACQAEFSTFLVRRGEGPRSDLARMRGARFVSAVEAPGNRTFDESVLKQITGGDTITARRLYEDLFEFPPTHKLFLAANHKPSVSEHTEAFWRRIRLIPFTVYISPERRDRELKNKLIEEVPGIFNWALEGCLEWQRGGLKEPEIVHEAIRTYRSEEDLVGEFINAACVVEPRSRCSASDMYHAFTTWWRETRGVHLRPPSDRWFARALGERPDVTSVMKRGLRGWKGLSIKVGFK